MIFRFWQFRRLWQFWQFLQPRQSAVRPLPPSAYSVSSAFQRCWVLHNYNLSRELDYVLAATLAATPIRPRPRRGRRSTARESQTIHARRSSVVPRLIAGMDGTKAPAVACHAFGDRDCSRLAGCRGLHLVLVGRGAGALSPKTRSRASAQHLQRLTVSGCKNFSFLISANQCHQRYGVSDPRASALIRGKTLLSSAYSVSSAF